MKNTLIHYMTEMKSHVEHHNSLNPTLWDNKQKLKREIKKQCLKIVDTFKEQALDDDEELVIKDIVLIGSNCSYNYNQFSDIDIHVIVDLPGDSYEYKYFMLMGRYWKADHEIEINGYPVELYVQSNDEKVTENAGQYSIQNDKWIIEPSILEKPTTKGVKDAETLMDEIKTKFDKLVEEKNVQGIHDLVEELRMKRKKSLKKDGEYGVDNLVYKGLRANKVFKDVSDKVNQITTDALSLNETASKSDTLSSAKKELVDIYYSWFDEDNRDNADIQMVDEIFCFNITPSNIIMSANPTQQHLYWLPLEETFIEWCKKYNIFLDDMTGIIDVEASGIKQSDLQFIPMKMYNCAISHRFTYILEHKKITNRLDVMLKEASVVDFSKYRWFLTDADSCQYGITFIVDDDSIRTFQNLLDIIEPAIKQRKKVSLLQTIKYRDVSNMIHECMKNYNINKFIDDMIEAGYEDML